MKATTNIRIYTDTHSLLKRFAKKHRLSLSTLVHRLALKVKFENPKEI